MTVPQEKTLTDSFGAVPPVVGGWQNSSYAQLTLIWLLGIVCVLDAMVIASLLTPIKAEFGFTDEQVGRLSSMFTLAGLAGAPVFGVLANRFGRKPVLLAGVAIWSVSSIATGFAAGFLGLLFWRIATGFGEAAYNSIAPSWLADLYRPRWRNLVFSLYMLKNKIGTAAALALGGCFSSVTLRPFRWGFPAFLAATSLLACAVFAIAYGSRDLAITRICVAAGIALFGFSAGTLTPLVVETLPPHLRNSATAWSIVLASGLAGIVGPELVGRLSDVHTLALAVFVAPAGYAVAGLLWIVLAIWLARRTQEPA